MDSIEEGMKVKEERGRKMVILTNKGKKISKVNRKGKKGKWERILIIHLLSLSFFFQLSFQSRYQVRVWIRLLFSLSFPFVQNITFTFITRSIYLFLVPFRPLEIHFHDPYLFPITNCQKQCLKNSEQPCYNKRAKPLENIQSSSIAASLGWQNHNCMLPHANKSS